LIGKDAPVYQVLHVDIRIQFDGDMAVSGSGNPSVGRTAGALMIFAVRSDFVGDSNVVRDEVNIRRWRGREMAVSVPPLTAERSSRCETICVVQEAGTGRIAGGSKI